MSLDRMFFGKKYEKLSNSKKIKTVKKHYLFLVLCFMLLSASFFIMTFNNVDLINGLKNQFIDSKEYDRNTDVFTIVNITYNNLTEEEIDFFNYVFAKVNPLYLDHIDKVIVTTDVQKEGCNEGSVACFVPKEKKIIIPIEKSEDKLKIHITHELLHSFFTNDSGDTPAHSIVYQLGNKKVAFKE